MHILILYDIVYDIVSNLYHMYLSLLKTYMGVGEQKLFNIKLLAIYVISLPLSLL